MVDKMRLSRRNFLKALGVTTAGATVLAGCGKDEEIVKVADNPSASIKPVSAVKQELVATQCPYCGVGCGSYWVVENGEIVASRPDNDHPDNKGMQCVKGLNAYEVFTNQRLTKPLIRKDPSTKGTFDGLQEVSWEEALDYVATKFTNIKKQYGGNAIGYYGSGQLTLEAQYLANKMWKSGFESNSIEANARMCMATAVAGYTKALGSDAPPTCYDDIYETDLIIDIGHNMRAAHSVLFWQIGDEKKKRLQEGKKLETYVIETRKTGTAIGWEEVDPENSYYMEVKPNGDVALLNAVGYVIVYELKAVNEEKVSTYAVGYKEYKEGVKKYTPEFVQDYVGVSPEEIRTLAKKIVEAKNGFLTMWAMGVNQRTVGTKIVEAIINLHLITGNIGKPGAGPFSITGQPNAMGERLAGGLTDKLPGNRKLKDPKAIKACERVWGEGTLANASKAENRDAIIGMMERAIGLRPDEDPMKAIYFAYTTHINLPDQDNLVRPALMNMFVVSADIYEDAPNLLYSDVVLPASTIGEVSGTYINSIRRFYVVDKAIDGPEGTLPDMDMVIELAHKMAEKEPERAFFWKDKWSYKKDVKGIYESEPVFMEFIDILKGSDADISGIEGYEHIRNLKGIMWPAPTKEIADQGGFPRRYMNQEEGWTNKPYGLFPTKTGKANIIFGDQLPVQVGKEKFGEGLAEYPETEFVGKKDVPEGKYPYWLALGIVYEHFHTAKTIRSKNLLNLVPEMYVEMHEEDAAALGIKDADWVKVTSRRGSITCKASVGANSRIGSRGRNLVPKGYLFAPWNLSVADSAIPKENKWLVNILPHRQFDPDSKEGDFKHCPVRIEKIEV